MISLALGLVAIASLSLAVRFSRDRSLALLRAETLLRQRNLAYEFLRQAENYSTTLEVELMQVRRMFHLDPSEGTARGVRRKLQGKPEGKPS